MKKNLRIVSVAAAALLAVAPVAAAGVAAPAATVSAATSGAFTEINAGAAIDTNANSTYDVDVTPSLTAVAAVKDNKGQVISNGSLTGTISATYGGQSYTATLDTKNGHVKVANANGGAVTDVNKDLVAGKYTITITGVAFNFGTVNANKENVKIGSANSNVEFSQDGGNTWHKVVTISKLDQSGVVSNLSVRVSNVNALNLTNGNNINFYQNSNGNQVTTGSVSVTAGAQSKLNVSSVVAAIVQKYSAAQGNNNAATPQTPSVKEIESDVKASLKAANIPVDNAGWFTAPSTFTVNVKATSSINGLTATLPVTVNVENGVNTTVPSQSKTIMHNAYFYDKDAKRVGTDKATRYNTVTVAMNTTKLANGISYYEVIENGKATGKFINADNIDGTKRTLKHNAYVYRSSKKRANKVVLKKGTEVTTYGGSYTFKNGKQYYKIGNNTDKTYVKVANF
ncbi:SLAP domain-containing protein [Lactobacillus amylovorus]|uniref:SLAP domain-containing protein n=1 Tax=Lactobacillus amylovorus TaxID=1604 RepID=UPI00232ADC66|nr:SLAP domain-containing protein [Lactobacillus amylovorus]MDB6228231.1 SLAP domain-containing protein [Lactobacillus amylovorus]